MSEFTHRPESVVPSFNQIVLFSIRLCHWVICDGVRHWKLVTRILLLSLYVNNRTQMLTVNLGIQFLYKIVCDDARKFTRRKYTTPLSSTNLLKLKICYLSIRKKSGTEFTIIIRLKFWEGSLILHHPIFTSCRSWSVTRKIWHIRV